MMLRVVVDRYEFFFKLPMLMPIFSEQGGRYIIPNHVVFVVYLHLIKTTIYNNNKNNTKLLNLNEYLFKTNIVCCSKLF